MNNPLDHYPFTCRMARPTASAFPGFAARVVASHFAANEARRVAVAPYDLHEAPEPFCESELREEFARDEVAR